MGKKTKLRKVINEKPSIGSDNQFTRLMIIFASVTVIFLVFYFITLVVPKDSTDIIDTEVDSTEIQYTNILVGRLFSQSADEYYVLATLEDDPYNELYDYLLGTYSGEKDAIPYYKVDLSSSFNKPYYASESKLKITNISDIRFKEATLLYIKDKTIVSSYEGKDAIIKLLDSKIS